MSAVSILVDVHCNVGHDHNPVYRVYVDDELLTERTWTWPSYEVLIRENIHVEFEEYGNHILRIENCGKPNNFYFTSIVVNGKELTQWEPRKSKNSEDQAKPVMGKMQEITFVA